MEDAIDGDADKRPLQLDDSCRGNKLPDSSILRYDHKSSVARRRRIEIRRLKYMSSFGQPDGKRSRSAISTSASTTSARDVTTERAVAVTGLSCKPDLSVVARSIPSLPANEDEVSPAALPFSIVQMEMSLFMKVGNEGEAPSSSTGHNEAQASFAASKDCSVEVETIRASPSGRCQEITGTARMTNAADLEEPCRKIVTKSTGKENPSLDGLSDERHARALDSSRSCESEDSPHSKVFLEEARNEQKSALMRAGLLLAFEQRRHVELGSDREESCTVESSAISAFDTPTYTRDLPSSSSLSSVAVDPPDSQAWELSTGVQSIQGRRKQMEDAVTVASLPCELTGCCTGVRGAESSRSWMDNCNDYLHFCGVYDGHGGAEVARHCSKRLHLALAEEVRVRMAAYGHQTFSRNGTSNNADFWKEVWERAMSDCFLRMDQEVVAMARGTVGSTAVVAVVSACQIIVANCGDSRAVLSRGGQAIALSVDHKPERADETARIEAAGGIVICWNGPRVSGVLAMTRAIGDRFLKPFVIADPEVTCTARCEEDECLILASDGLWDVLSNDKVCEMARECVVGERDGAQAAATRLTSAAYENSSSDNISVVVVDLTTRSRPAPVVPSFRPVPPQSIAF